MLAAPASSMAPDASLATLGAALVTFPALRGAGRSPRWVADDATAVAVAELTEQLSVKDRQIADLSDALVSAQKPIEQACALHAADKQVVIAEPAASFAAESVKRGGRWRRFVEAWAHERLVR